MRIKLELARAGRRKVRKILACRTDRFGEFLLNIPAFRVLQRSFPEGELFICCGHSNAGLAEIITGSADRVIVFENRKHNLLELLVFVKRIMQERFDICLVLNPLKELHLAAFLARVPERVGYSRKLGFLLTKTLPDQKHLELQHEAQSNLQLARLAGAAEGDINDFSIPCLDNADSLLPERFFRSGFIALHPWISDQVKQWPHERFLGLIKMLTQRLGVNIAVIGGNKEAADHYCSVYSSLCAENVCNLTGKTTLLELLALLKKARLLVSGDSGPMHLAAAAGIPVVAIFRNDIPGKTPRRWGPLGGGHVILQRNSLDNISIEEVFASISGMLSKQKDINHRGGLTA